MRSLSCLCPTVELTGFLENNFHYRNFPSVIPYMSFLEGRDLWSSVVTSGYYNFHIARWRGASVFGTQKPGGRKFWGRMSGDSTLWLVLCRCEQLSGCSNVRPTLDHCLSKGLSMTSWKVFRDPPRDHQRYLLFTLPLPNKNVLLLIRFIFEGIGRVKVFRGTSELKTQARHSSGCSVSWVPCRVTRCEPCSVQ